MVDGPAQLGEGADTASPQAAPTEDAPERSVIRNRAYDIVLANVQHWVEDGLHVFRAADFDLIAMDEDRGRAVEKFVEEVYSLWFALGDLVKRDDATDHEYELYVRLAEPIIEAHRRAYAEQRRARFFARFRRRGDHSDDWSFGSSLAKPNRPSIA